MVKDCHDNHKLGIIIPPSNYIWKVSLTISDEIGINLILK